MPDLTFKTAEMRLYSYHLFLNGNFIQAKKFYSGKKSECNLFI